MAVVYNYNAGPTYTKIASQTLGSATASITFSNIPQNYTDLVIVFTGKSTTTGSATNGFRCRVNGDTGSNYSGTPIKGDGSTASGTRYTSTAFFEPADIAQTSSTSLSTIIINFMNYSNTTTYKTFISRGNTPSSVVEAYATLWRSTSAIDSVTLSRDFGVNNLASGCTATLYGIAAALKPKATGGNTVRTDGTYWYHTFTSSGVFTPTQGITADYLVVAGGGAGASVGGSAETGGGGGAGGFRVLLSQSLSGQSYTVTVGAGGASGSSGVNSSLGSISATGGGDGAGGSGGSGGGGLSQDGAQRFGGAGNAGSYSPVEGYAGGNGNSSSNSYAGGGGGAGAAGANGTGGQSGAGGIGAGGVSYANYATINAMALATGTGVLSSGNYYFAGGGGGGSASGVSAGSGGTGGGGAGLVAGTVNTGGGGGGGSPSSGSSRAGGSGIVIVRYSA